LSSNSQPSRVNASSAGSHNIGCSDRGSTRAFTAPAFSTAVRNLVPGVSPASISSTVTPESTDCSGN
jgi:hypothetical protein